MQAEFNLFSTQEMRDTEKGAGKLMMMNPDDLVDFQNHTFIGISQSDPRYTSLTQSIKDHGIMEPLIAFRNERDEFEIISGHCRRMIASDLELDQVPVLLKNVDRNEATIMMITTNLERRESILPSERAKSYQLLLETIENQNGKKLDEGKYDRWEKLAELLGVGSTTLKRYLVDIGRIHLKPATVIATLTEDTQNLVYQYFVETGGLSNKGVTPSHSQAVVMKELEKTLKDSLTFEQVCEILEKPKANQKTEFKISQNMYRNYFSDCNNQKDIEREIIKAMNFYKKYKDQISENEAGMEL